MAERSTSEVATEGPHQPKHFQFPAKSFGKKGEMKSFQKKWFEEWTGYT